MEVSAFSKSKSGKKSIATYTVSTHHDFPADIAAKFAETACTRYAEALDKATLKPVMLQCTLKAENSQNARKTERTDSQGPMQLPLIGETESDRRSRLKGGNIRLDGKE